MIGASRLAFLAKSSVTAVAEVIRKKVGVIPQGGASISTTSSKFGGSSVYFDAATSDTLELDPILTTDSTDWTLEFWINPDATGITEYFIGQDQSADRGFYVYQTSAGLRMFWRNVFAATTIGSLSSGTWQHVAIVKNGTSVDGYIDGVQGATTQTVSASEVVASGSNLFIGDRDSGGNYDGYMDEIRISNTARYTTGFTPATQTFTNDDDTLLLLHCNGTSTSTYFTDDNGTVRPRKDLRGEGSAHIETSQSKFGGTSLELSHSTFDYLLSEADSDIILHGTDDFTIETFIRTKNNNHAAACIFTQIFSSGDVPIWFGLAAGTGSNRNVGGNKVCAESYDSGWTSLVESTTTLANNTWYHVALVRSSGTITLYIDGTSEDSATFTTIPSANQADLRIGRRWDSYSTSGDTSIDGFLDEYRVSNVARYTGNFTPTTEPFVNDDNTLLLCHFDGTDGSNVFHDDNGKDRKALGVRAEGIGALDTAQYKFGNSSFVADGSGDDNLAIDQNAYDWTVFANHSQSDNYTIECWIRSTNVATTNAIFGSRTSTASHNWDLEIRTNNGNGTLRWFNGNSQLYYSSGGVVSANTWHHIAAVIEGADLTVYVDGTAEITQTRTDSNTTGGSDFFIGKGGYPTLNKFYGNIDEFRISDIARYTTSFTPPTEAFQNDANTVLLLHMDGKDGSTDFYDDNGVY